MTHEHTKSEASVELDTVSLKTLQQAAEADRSKLTEAIKSMNQSTDDTISMAASMAASIQNSPSVHEEDYQDADEYIVNRSSTGSSIGNAMGNANPITLSYEGNNLAHNTLDDSPLPQPPHITPPHTDDSTSQHSGGSPTMHRRSVISDYAPSIHEASQVKYVVDSSSSPGEHLHPKPSKPVVRISRTPSKSSKDSANPLKKKHTPHSSGDLGSTSGSSKYPASNYSAPLQTTAAAVDTTATTATATAAGSNAESVSWSIPEEKSERAASSSSLEIDVGPLSTHRERGMKVEVERQHLTPVEPSIPSRSPRRPISMLNTSGAPPLLGKFSHRRSNSDDPKTTANVQAKMAQDDERVVSTSSKKEPRPLPPPPVPQHNSRPTSRVITQDDGFVTDEEDPSETKSKKKAHRKRHSKRLSSTKKFNQETLLQMLQVTEGTIIGQEFQNIGLEAGDKQLLERLVDSLSRLTADMIVDPERHSESVNRLNKAIKALEGF